MLSVDEAIMTRRSVRAFLPDEDVPRETVEHILEVAARAPSGTNTQPWQVHVLTGAAKQNLTDAILEAFHNEPEKYSHDREYYLPEFREPYLARRRKVGWDLYGLLGIEKGDRDRMRAQVARNYMFFDAPVGMIFTIDYDMGWASWMDYGMFMQNIMLAARGQGLHTCPQVSFGGYHEVVERVLELPDGVLAHCGLSLGYEDESAVENQLHTTREPVADFTVFHEG
jgi:nitroreductase